MSRVRQTNTYAVIVWFLGLLGCAGYINVFYPVGFFPVVVPLLFWIFGSKYTKGHCRAYFNVLITAFVIHIVGLVLDQILDFLGIHIFDLIYLGLIYFAIHCLMGFVSALNNRTFKPELVIHLFK